MNVLTSIPQGSSALIVSCFGEVHQMDECLLLMLEGVENDGQMPINHILRALPGVNHVYAGEDRFYFVSYDPLVTDYDVVIKTLMKQGLKVKRFQHILV